jgi:plastocyanin
MQMASSRSKKRICAMIALIALFSGISNTKIASLGEESHPKAMMNTLTSDNQNFNVAIDDSVTNPPAINVTINDFAFIPQNIDILNGTTIVWTNNDSVIYTLWFVIAENQTTYLLSDPITPGTSWSFTFYSPPTELQYYSFEQLWITGNITVYNGETGGLTIPHLR